MSIIFRSLQKLDSNVSNAIPSQLPETVTQGDLRTLSADRSNLKSILRIGLTFMGIVVLGLGVVLMAEYLTSREHLSADASADASRSIGKIPKTAATLTDNIQGYESQPNSKIKEDSNLQARFYPPQHQQSGPQALNSLEAANIDLPNVATASGSSTSYTSMVPGAEANESNPGQTTPNAIDTIDAYSPSTTNRKESLEAEKGVAQSTDLHTLALPQEQPVPSTRAIAIEPLAAEQRKADRIRLKALAKNAHIGQLARRTQSALAQNPMDTAQAGALIEELSREKGADHPFIAKLRAYFLFKQARHDEATVILERLIAVNADDIEAGVNLALIEIQTGQIPKAAERLKRLGVEHPDNTVVADLLRKLK